MPNYMNQLSLDIGTEWYDKHSKQRYEIISIEQEGIKLQQEKNKEVIITIDVLSLSINYYQLDDESCTMSNVLRDLQLEHKQLLLEIKNPEVNILKTFNLKLSKSILNIQDGIYEQYSEYDRRDVSHIIDSAIKDYLKKLIDDEANKLIESKSLQF